MDAAPRLTPERIRGIVFDLDGTLVDSYAAIAASLNHARSAYALPPLPTDEVRRAVGHGLESLVSELIGRRRVKPGVRIFRDHYARSYRHGTFLLPGVTDTLSELRRRGYVMGVASNKPAIFSRTMLEWLGLLELLADVQGPDTVGAAKPDPAMLRRSLEVLDLSPRHAVYVGDMALDALTAARAEVSVVLVPGGSSARDELVATGQRVLERFSDLLDVFVRPGSAV